MPDSPDTITDPLGGKKWLEAKVYARPQRVDREHSAILGCSIVTAGPALGHGVSLDDEFVAKVAELGNAERGGLKARFGHPNMCSTALGTFLGRWKSFSVAGNRALADLYLSNSAHKTPHGDLAEYVLGLAEKDPDMFGVSIVFSPGRTYKRDAGGAKVIHPYDDETEGMSDDERRERRGKYIATPGPEFVECAELHAADAVDEPAANAGGLFSRWTSQTLAAQATEFLDTHPEALDLLVAHPEVVADFQARYLAHQRRKQGSIPMADQTAAAPAAPAAPANESTPIQAATAGAEAAALEQSGDPAAQPEAATASAAQTVVQDVPPADDTPKVFSAAEFARIKAKFGAEAAAVAVETGGDYHTACEAAYDALLKERDELKAQLAAKDAGGTPAGFVPNDPDARKPGFTDLFQSPRRK